MNKFEHFLNDVPRSNHVKKAKMPSQFASMKLSKWVLDDLSLLKVLGRHSSYSAVVAMLIEQYVSQLPEEEQEKINGLRR